VPVDRRTGTRLHPGPSGPGHGLATRIWCYDHNYNSQAKPGDPGLAYPRTILSDPGAATFVSGVAFHGYEGQPSGMEEFHREFPSVPLHFTEGSVFGLKGGAELIARLRHRAASYNAWVTVLDDRGKPNNGPFEASRTIITVNPETFRPTVHFDYYLYGHFMRFIQRGAVRIGSTATAGGVSNVAFRNRDGSGVLLLVNADRRPQDVAVRVGRRALRLTVPAAAVATLTWPPATPSP
jgi:glucosylceramidase